ncbi:MAG: hypothetical protein KatS3mg024_0003 [Armatimonadota bacterium]|nr:MAG: hypothetical protein KatS3mg024_0003 [Armatimonadota bacterium]
MGKVHRLLRAWHKWVGVIAALALISFAVTGILLNNKETFGLKPAPAKPPAPANGAAAATPSLTTGVRLASLPVSPEQALAIARQKFGDVPLEKLELKYEKGALQYRIHTREKPPTKLYIDAATGGAVTQEPEAGAKLEAFILDLHHFNFAEGRFRIVADIFAGSLALLTASGLWLFVREEAARKRSRQIARERSSVQIAGRAAASRPVRARPSEAEG